MERQDAIERAGDSPLRLAMAGSDAGVALLHGRELLVDYSNPAHQAMFGWPVGSPLRDAGLTAGASERSLRDLVDQVLTTGRPAAAAEVPTVDGRTVSVTCSPVRTDSAISGVLLVAVDTSDQAQARRQAEDRNERLTVLDQATAAVTADLDPRRELTALAESVVPELADACAVYLIDHAPPRGQGRAAVPDLVRATRLVCVIDPRLGVPPPAPEVRLTVAASRPTSRAVVSHQVVMAHGAECEVASRGVGWLRALSPHSLVAVPLGYPEVLAVVTFVGRGDRPPYQSSDLALMREISARADVAVGHAMRLQHATEVALALQRGLLADPASVEGLDIAVRYRPAVPDLEVGGDWYDTLVLPDGDLGVAVGDVVGHDLYAVSTMGQLRSMLQALACQPGAEPAGVLTALNRLSSHLAVGNLATTVYGRLTPAADREGSTFTWANAGHPPPLLVTPEGTATVLDQVSSSMLALGDDAHTQASVPLPPGSLLLLYTDGLIEDPEQPAGDPITELAATVAGHAGLPVDELCDRLITGAPAADDIALLVVRVRD